MKKENPMATAVEYGLVGALACTAIILAAMGVEKGIFGPSPLTQAEEAPEGFFAATVALEEYVRGDTPSANDCLRLRAAWDKGLKWHTTQEPESRRFAGVDEVTVVVPSDHPNKVFRGQFVKLSELLDGIPAPFEVRVTFHPGRDMAEVNRLREVFRGACPETFGEP